MREFDRSRLLIRKLAERNSKTNLSKIILPSAKAPKIRKIVFSKLENIAQSILNAKLNKSPIIFSMGAHLIKNGLSMVFIELMKMGYVQYALGNEAVAIHDWELAYHGETEEDVRGYLSKGQSGLWDETGRYINKAIKLGNGINLGYGESVGKFIAEDGIGETRVRHIHKEISVLGEAYKLGIPFGIGASIGENIIHMHPECDGAAIGETSYRDFLGFVNVLENLEGGVYISIGSAVKSPMIFEKALSMARNVVLQEEKSLDDYYIIVNDIQPSPWNWKRGEPPKDNPAYYLRFFKTFQRMGGRCDYVELDNRVFLHNLYHLLKN